MSYLQKIIRYLRRTKSVIALPSASIFQEKKEVDRLNIRQAVFRTIRAEKSDLIFDPVGYHEFEWLVEKSPKVLTQLIADYYSPSPQVVLNMPKKGFTFRPIAYLQPMDSIVYQALVDKIIYYKRDYFSKQVYSDIIGKPDENHVFNNPVKHWLEMRDNIRVRHRRGCEHYFFSDISGYFENIKISPLLKQLILFVGRNETHYINYLGVLLETWHFAKAQGLVQPHPASSILGKIYLSQIDSHFRNLSKKYNRYVDEFHILSETKSGLLKSALELAQQLRDLGLNQNASKSKVLYGEQIDVEFNEDQDFFNHVNYLQNVRRDFTEAKDEIIKRFQQFMAKFMAGESVNYKIFRYCIRRFGRELDPIAIQPCFEIARKDYEQVTDIVRYLSLFVSNPLYSNLIATFTTDYLKNPELNYTNWVEAWLLGLVLDIPPEAPYDMEFIEALANDENKCPISRSLCYLIISKRHEPADLINFYSLYEKQNSVILKRALLVCISKLPVASKKMLFDQSEQDDINIRVLKLYLKENSYPIISKVRIQAKNRNN
jgi:hypothetical protein